MSVNLGSISLIINVFQDAPIIRNGMEFNVCVSQALLVLGMGVSNVRQIVVQMLREIIVYVLFQISFSIKDHLDVRDV